MVKGKKGGYDSRGNFRAEAGTETKYEFNVGSPWVELTQDVRVVNGNSDETDPDLFSSRNAKLFTIDDGNLISLSEKYSHANEGESTHSIILKILDPDGVFIQNFIDNSYGRLYQSVFARIAKIGEKYNLQKEAVDQMIEMGEQPFSTAQYVREVTNNRERAQLLRIKAKVTGDVSFIEDAEALETLATTNEVTILEEGAAKAIESLEKNRTDNEFDIFAVSATLQKELTGLAGKGSVTDQLNTIVRSNQQVFIRYGFGSDYKNSNTWRKFQIATLFNITDSTDNGMLEIKLVPVEYVGKDLRRSSSTASKTEDDLNDTRFSVSVPLAQIVRNARRRYDQPLTFNTEGNAIDDLQYFKTAQVDEVVFNNTNNIVSILERMYSQYLQKNLGSPVTEKQGFLPIVMLHPLLQNHIETAIDNQLKKLNVQTRFSTENEKQIVEVLSSDLLRIECLKNILGPAGIHITVSNVADYTRLDAGKEGDTRQTFYLTFASKGLDNFGRPLCEKNVLDSIRYLYSEVGLELAMYNTLDGEPFELQDEMLKVLFLDRLFDYDVEKERFYLKVLKSAKPTSRTETKRIYGTRESITTGKQTDYVRDEKTVYFRGNDEIDVVDLFPTGITDTEGDGGHFATYTVKIYGDNEIINSIVAPMTMSLKKSVVDNFVTRVKKGMMALEKGGSRGVDKYSLVNRFLNVSTPSFANYVESVNNTVMRSFEPLEGFNEDFELLLDEISPELKESLSNLPVFTANYKDANVHQVVSKGIGESFSFLQGNTLFDLFDDQGVQDLQEFFESKDNSYYKSQKFEGLSEEAFVLMIPKILRSAYTGNSSIMNLLDTLSQDIQNLDDEVSNAPSRFIVDNVLQVFSENLVEALKQSTGDRRVSPRKILSYFAYIQHLSNSIRQLSIKTIPRFNMQREYIGKPCVFLNYNNFYAYISNRLNSKGFLSGIYTIFGYEHTISSSDCFSSFYLQRNELANITANSIFSGVTQ